MNKAPIFLDNVSLTDTVTVTHEGTKYKFRQLLPANFVYPQSDLVLAVEQNTIYNVAGVIYNSNNELLNVIVVDPETLQPIKLNLNNIRILHDVVSFDPKLN